MLRGNTRIKNKCPNHSISSKEVKGTQGKNLEIGGQGRGHGVLFPGLLSLLSYRIQDHQPSGGVTHNGLDLPTSVTKKTPKQACLQPELTEIFSQLKVCLLR